MYLRGLRLPLLSRPVNLSRAVLQQPLAPVALCGRVGICPDALCLGCSARGAGGAPFGGRQPAVLLVAKSVRHGDVASRHMIYLGSCTPRRAFRRYGMWLSVDVSMKMEESGATSGCRGLLKVRPWPDATGVARAGLVRTSVQAEKIEKLRTPQVQLWGVAPFVERTGRMFDFYDRRCRTPVNCLDTFRRL